MKMIMAIDMFCMILSVMVLYAGFANFSDKRIQCLKSLGVGFFSLSILLFNMYLVPQFFYFTNQSLAVVLFLFFLKEGTVTAFYKSVVIIGLLLLVTIFWGTLFQLITEYTPNKYHRLDAVIGILILLSCGSISKGYGAFVKYRFYLSKKSKFLFGLNTLLLILFFTMIFPRMRKDSDFLYLMGIVVMAVLIYLYVLLFIRIYRYERSEKYYLSVYEQAAILNRSAEQKENIMIKAKHNLKARISAIGYFIDKNDLAGLRQYYQSYLLPEYVCVNKEFINCENMAEILENSMPYSVLGKTVVYEYCKYAIHMGITVRLKTDNPVLELYMSEEILSNILNIILENACEELAMVETGKRKEAFLSVYISSDKEKISILVANSRSKSKEQKKNGNFGQGIKIIRQYEKAMKKLSVQYFSGENSFVVRIEVRK